MKNEKNEKPVFGKLEELSEQQQSWIIEIALNSRQVDILAELKSRGIEVSASTLSRFIQRHQGKRMLDEAAEMKETVKTLAEQGKEGTLREGSIEAARQRLFDRVLRSQDPEEALALFGSMQKEQATLKELELEARKVAVAEAQVQLQAQKLAMEARKNGAGGTAAHGPIDAEVVESSVVTEAISDREQLLIALVKDLAEILNRGGEPLDKVLEARSRLGQGTKLLGNGG